MLLTMRQHDIMRYSMNSDENQERSWLVLDLSTWLLLLLFTQSSWFFPISLNLSSQSHEENASETNSNVPQRSSSLLLLVSRNAAKEILATSTEYTNALDAIERERKSLLPSVHYIVAAHVQYLAGFRWSSNAPPNDLAFQLRHRSCAGSEKESVMLWDKGSY